MAKKETPVSEEKIYIIPIRREWLKVPRNQRGKKAIDEIRNFLSRHIHSDDVKLSQKLNEMIWKSGIKNPPSRVKVKVSMKDGVVIAKLPEEIEIKKGEKKGKLESLKEKAKDIKEGKTAKIKKPAKSKEKDTQKSQAAK